MKLVQAKVWNKGGYLPEQVHKSDVGYDLRCSEDLVIEAGEYYMLPLDIVVKPPEGYHFEVVPRSSTFKKHGILLVNSVGIIDPSYSGENDTLAALIYRPSDVMSMDGIKDRSKRKIISKGTRLFQIIPRKTVYVEWVDMTDSPIEDEDRGGIGSTGE